jgi:hypothetical protein
MPRISSILLILLVLFLFMRFDKPLVFSEIAVLIYDSEGSSKAAEIQQMLEVCNRDDLLPGYRFRVRRGWFDIDDRLDAAALEGTDVLLVPGGYPAMLHQYWKREDLRGWVRSGGGYVGICAGEILAVEGFTKDPLFGKLEGLRIAPNIQRTGTQWVGGRNIRMTEEGTLLFGLSGDQRVLNWNGSVLGYRQVPSQGPRIFAEYSGNQQDLEIRSHGKGLWSSQWAGQAAILGDYYGLGRVVLSGPHPEHPLGSGLYQKPRLIGGMVKWASRDDSPVPTVLGREDILAAETTTPGLSAVSCDVTSPTRVASVNLFVREGEGRGILGLYRSGKDGKPTELLSQTPAFDLHPGWQRGMLTEEIEIGASTTVWLAWILEKPVILAADYPKYSRDLGDASARFSWLEWGSLVNEELPALFPSEGQGISLLVSIHALGEAILR